MSDEQPVTGPDRVGGMVVELFEYVLENGANITDELADESVSMARNRLSEICTTCQELSSDEPPPVITLEKTTPAKAPSGNEQRKMHLLRLVSCKLSHAFDTQNNPNPIDRQASVGIDFFLKRTFTPAVSEMLNDQAQRILMVSGIGDNAVLNNILSNAQHRNFLNNILIRLAQTFKKFDTAKYLLMDDLNESRKSGTRKLESKDFHMIMSSLLNDVFLMARSQDDGAMLDYLFGPTTTKMLSDVSDLLSKDRMRG